MSVTLKLADEDAAVVGSILRAVAQIPPQIVAAPGATIMVNNYQKWHQDIRSSHTGRDLAKLLELSGAFRVAVRANER